MMLYNKIFVPACAEL